MRAVCGLPLGDPRALVGAVMVNLIGDLWRDGAPAWRTCSRARRRGSTSTARTRRAPGRKMGHVLLLDDDTDRALATAEDLLGALSLRVAERRRARNLPAPRLACETRATRAGAARGFMRASRTPFLTSR